MSVCYNLISCDGSSPDILNVTDVILAPYVDQLVSINGSIPRYYVRETHQLIARNIDNTSAICSAGILPLTWEIDSIIYNGVEQVTSTQTYTLTSGNIDLLNCVGSVCGPDACPTANNYANLAEFLNNVFTLFNIPLTATPTRYAPIDLDDGCILICGNLSDSFDIKILRTAGPFSGFEYHYGIDSFSNPVYTMNGASSTYKLLVDDQCVGSPYGITTVTPETICADVCGCPPGFTLGPDGLTCIKFESIAATQNPTTYTAGPGSFAAGFYGSHPGQFYQDITNEPWPIIATTGSCTPATGTCSILNNNALVPLTITNAIANSVWGGVGPPFTDYRIKAAGIWTTVAPNPVNEWIGFTYCVEIATTKTYYLAFAVDDVAKFYLDGTLMIDHSTVGWSFRTWKIIPVTLNAGTHIFDGRVLNGGGSATFAFEIYDATLAQLLAVTTIADLTPLIAFSTKDFIGQTWQTGEVSGYTCPDGYSLNTCDGLVCSRIVEVPNIPCCYDLTDCNSGIVINTDTDLSSYVGQTIKIDGSPNCFVVSVAEVFCFEPIPVAVISSSSTCDECNPCFLLTNCRNPQLTLIVRNDLSTQVGDIVLVNGDCWTITSSYPDCTQSVVITIDGTFVTCYDCLPKCYNLINCEDTMQVVNVATDLSQYVGQVVHLEKCGNTCWYVEETTECLDCLQVVVSEFFADCTSCAPIPPELPPIELHPRRVKPGYYTPGCDPDYTEKINKHFSDALYNEVIAKRYGITMCCQEDRDKWEIKKELLELKAIYDPTVCASTINRCCPPTCVSSVIYTLNSVSCPAPSDVISTLLYPTGCPAPTNVTTIMAIQLIVPCIKCPPF